MPAPAGGALGSKPHTAAGVESAFAALGESGWNRLRSAARGALRGYGLEDSAHGPGDLVQEACLRMLSGSRSWRRGVDFEYQVARVMASIASNWRRSKEAKPEIREAQLPRPDAGAEDEDDPLLDSPSPEGSHEDGIVAAQQLAEIEKLLDGDAQALQVVELLELGLTRPEMCQRTQMSEKQLAAAIRRVRRAGERLRAST